MFLISYVDKIHNRTVCYVDSKEDILKASMTSHSIKLHPKHFLSIYICSSHIHVEAISNEVEYVTMRTYSPVTQWIERFVSSRQRRLQSSNDQGLTQSRHIEENQAA